jgi:hypothetical protein
MYRLVIAYLLAYDLFQLHLHPRKATHPSHHLVVDIVCGGFVWGGSLYSKSDNCYREQCNIIKERFCCNYPCWPKVDVDYPM